MNFHLNLDKRTKVLAKNIGLTSIYRAASICINFISIPLLVKLLGTEDYGIWIAISSILAWINFFDFGISISLQNRIARTIALGKIRETKIIISSTYGLVSVITVVILVLISVLVKYVNWSSLLNIEAHRIAQIQLCIMLIAVSISVQIVLKLVNAVIFAYQKTNLSELINLIMQVIMLAVIITLSLSNPPLNLLIYVSIIYCVVPVVTFILVNILIFRLLFKTIAPSFKFISITRFKEIATNSSNFLLLQLYGLVLFQTDNFVVANLFTPASVTTFSITSKYFSLISVAFGVILMPYWAATSEALAIEDLRWLKWTLKRNHYLLFALSLLAVLMVTFSQELIRIWTKEALDIPISLSITMALYTIVLAYNNVYGIILNAANLFRIQIILICVIVVVNIPLSYILVLRTNLGMTGITISNLICVAVFGFFVTLQVNKLLKGSAKGIWGR